MKKELKRKEIVKIVILNHLCIYPWKQAEVETKEFLQKWGKLEDFAYYSPLIEILLPVLPVRREMLPLVSHLIFDPEYKKHSNLTPFALFIAESEEYPTRDRVEAMNFLCSPFPQTTLLPIRDFVPIIPHLSIDLLVRTTGAYVREGGEIPPIIGQKIGATRWKEFVNYAFTFDSCLAEMLFTYAPKEINLEGIIDPSVFATLRSDISAQLVDRLNFLSPYREWRYQNEDILFSNPLLFTENLFSFMRDEPFVVRKCALYDSFWSFILLDECGEDHVNIIHKFLEILDFFKDDIRSDTALMEAENKFFNRFGPDGFSLSFSE